MVSTAEGENQRVNKSTCCFDQHIAHRVDKPDVDIARQLLAVDHHAVDLADAADDARGVAQVVGVDGGDDVSRCISMPNQRSIPNS